MAFPLTTETLARRVIRIPAVALTSGLGARRLEVDVKELRFCSCTVVGGLKGDG